MFITKKKYEELKRKGIEEEDYRNNMRFKIDYQIDLLRDYWREVRLVLNKDESVTKGGRDKFTSMFIGRGITAGILENKLTIDGVEFSQPIKYRVETRADMTCVMILEIADYYAFKKVFGKGHTEVE